MSRIPYLAAILVFVLGTWGVARSRDLIHAVVCLSVAQSGTYLWLLSVGYQRHAHPPVFGSPAKVTRPVVDPFVQAMTLTDIVVSACVTALLLAIAVQISKHHGTVDPDELRSLTG
jgi:multicomponent Na+:H+ antiporter subunit C